MRSALLLPGGTVLALFFAFYLLGWIPPVPLSVQEIGIYHKVEKKDGGYLVSQENPWWRFWRSGDQDFMAEPGDEIFVFVRIFSPSRFSDSVVLHWQFHDPREGWKTSDRIPMGISGGREGGYRGYASKKNYSDGEWRVLVETTDGREVGRLKFWVTKLPVAFERRVFETLPR
ncbi:MAG TPA: DUF2914 domain-containing protein [Pseudobdellovibrionaceae bacterium]|nr:DUF2914 domain-containing protein [Pseudobdellovibrionaceae bacterium]